MIFLSDIRWRISNQTETCPRLTPPTAPPQCTCTGSVLTMGMTTMDTSQATMVTMLAITLPRLTGMDTLTPTSTTSRDTATARLATLDITQSTLLTTLLIMLLIMPLIMLTMA